MRNDADRGADDLVHVSNFHQLRRCGLRRTLLSANWFPTCHQKYHMNHRAVLALQERRGCLHAPPRIRCSHNDATCFRFFAHQCRSLRLLELTTSCEASNHIGPMYYCGWWTCSPSPLRISPPLRSPLLQQRRRLLGLFSNNEMKRMINICRPQKGNFITAP